jgi:hypothetical protein
LVFCRLPADKSPVSTLFSVAHYDLSNFCLGDEQSFFPFHSYSQPESVPLLPPRAWPRLINLGVRFALTTLVLSHNDATRPCMFPLVSIFHHPTFTHFCHGPASLNGSSKASPVLSVVLRTYLLSYAIWQRNTRNSHLYAISSYVICPY